MRRKSDIRRFRFIWKGHCNIEDILAGASHKVDCEIVVLAIGLLGWREGIYDFGWKEGLGDNWHPPKLCWYPKFVVWVGSQPLD